MHKRWLNHARLKLSLTPRGPLLIKSGIETPDPTRPGMEFVRTRHPDLGDTVYLPGTGLKGAWRSHAERILNGHDIEVCDPLNKKSPCRNVRGPASSTVFRQQCPICKIFGSLKVSGRCNVLDAYPWDPHADAELRGEAAARANRTEQRFQVGIDRKSQQARRGTLFDLEVVVAGTFHTEVLLWDFELWQLGLIAAVLQDLGDGMTAVGFGKARGLGQVAVGYLALDIEQSGAAPRQLAGAGSLVPPSDRTAYGLETDDRIDLPAPLQCQPTWRGQRLTVAGERVTSVLATIVDGPLRRFLASRQDPRTAGGGLRS